MIASVVYIWGCINMNWFRILMTFDIKICPTTLRQMIRFQGFARLNNKSDVNCIKLRPVFKETKKIAKNPKNSA